MQTRADADPHYGARCGDRSVSQVRVMKKELNSSIKLLNSILTVTTDVHSWIKDTFLALQHNNYMVFFKRFYLLIFKEKGREGERERERNIYL